MDATFGGNLWMKLDREERAVGRIVVGVDGSETSREALREAIAMAKSLGHEVDAVRAWWASYGTIEVPFPIDRDAIETAERQALHDLVASAVAAPVIVNEVVVEGDPAHVLLDAAKDADLLVVGSRGHGGFLGLLLGSVSHKVLGNAQCPVLVVPHREPEVPA